GPRLADGLAGLGRGGVSPSALERGGAGRGVRHGVLSGPDIADLVRLLLPPRPGPLPPHPDRDRPPVRAGVRPGHLGQRRVATGAAGGLVAVQLAAVAAAGADRAGRLARRPLGLPSAGVSGVAGLRRADPVLAGAEGPVARPGPERGGADWPAILV